MNLEELFLESIDECLSSIGEECKKSIYFQLEIEYKLNKREIPFRIKDFSEAIENIFGLGAKILEIRMLKTLFKKIGHISPQFCCWENLDFTQYIEAAIADRNHLIQKETQRLCV
jgi:hypothetical protein